MEVAKEMNETGVSALSQFFSMLWTGLGNIQIPLTNLTGQTILIAPFALLAVVGIIKAFFPHGNDVSGGRGKNSRRKDK